MVTATPFLIPLNQDKVNVIDTVKHYCDEQIFQP